MRATACMSSASRKVGPRRALLLQVDRRAMCTNGSGTNSVNPPVSFCRSRVRTMWRAQCTGCSTEPNMIVMFESQPDLVGGAVGLEPLLGVDLVGAEDRPDLVVEDLGRGARQRAQPGVHQAAEVVGQRLAEALGALGDLERGEAVDVDVGRRLLHGPGDVDVVVAVEVRVDAALQADLGGAELGGLARPGLRCRRA